MTNRRGLQLFGHPIHPMLAGFPVAFWMGASLADVVGWLRPEPLWYQLAFWSLLAGTVTALPAAASGFWDLICLPAGHRAERTAWWHMGVMSGALSLELASLALRRGDLGNAPPSMGAVGLALAAAALCSVGGWMGGELVFRHGLAVDAPEIRGEEIQREGEEEA